MHMARLANPSRGPKEYSLSRCTHHYSPHISHLKKSLVEQLQLTHNGNSATLAQLKAYTKQSSSKAKQPMEKLFARPKVLKSGQPGKTMEMPEVEELHTSPELVRDWVHYSTLDSELTFYLREILVSELARHPLNCEDMESLWEFYLKYWLPLGEVLTDMERIGMQLDLEHLRSILIRAGNDKQKHWDDFMRWVLSHDPSLKFFNPNSSMHMQQLLFAPFNRDRQGEKNSSDDEAGAEKVNSNLSNKGQDYFPAERSFVVENTDKQPGDKKNTFLTIKGLGIPVATRTETGLPSVDSGSLKILAGDPEAGKWGTAYTHLASQGKEELGKSCCIALSSLLQFKSIETLVNSFITPLISLADPDGRIHYSLNINTETGRLSARRPNTQNQPALDKDIYKIRKAFVSDPGKSLIVADYGQLELRVLAHMTNCKSMLDAFAKGGDFHSRTAISMYPEIKEAVEKGEVLLEWDASQGAPPVPLLKTVYAAERKTAKTMNFSIAYGKSAHGFAKDWECSIEEAQAALKRWYSDRREVEAWQMAVKNTATTKGFTRTLLGRYRRLTDLIAVREKRQHGLRAAINTPIQGGAADIVTAAMVRLHYDSELKELGWKLLMQIHDEVILEGPDESASIALQRVKDLMEHPLDEPLRLALEVDAKVAKNWYEAK
mmetsp:Transcript_6476/g.11323  ORF Transcript_6476/g.11323 Transcript_6476/m.11323 type:complete len:662 (+) Transcript_6476:223-2208(+)